MGTTAINELPAVRVCVLTGRKMAAIASVALSGDGAAAMLGGVFVGRVPELGQSRYGRICDTDGAVLDSVVVGCEAANRYVVHCHGNPLLAGQIAGLFARLGARVQSPQAYAMEGFSQTSKTRIAAEAKLAMAQAATLEAARWLARQMDAGLSAWTADWISRNPIDINVLQEQSKAIGARRAVVCRVVEGVRIAMIGAPNSGKSTLMNWLAGRQTAIVSDTAGTTRDWVSMNCRIGPVLAEIVDTAGLDEALAARNPIEKAAQDAARQTAAQSDLILHLIDSTHPTADAPGFASGAIVLNVFTKIDLASDLKMLSGGVAVSAITDRGLDALCAAIVKALQVDTLDDAQPIAFTPRQYDLLTQLAVCPDEPSARALLTELLGSSGV